MSHASGDTIDRNGYPLAFKVRAGEAGSPALGAAGRDVFKVEARQLAGHQKEAVVHEGEGGAAWRLSSDEGGHLKGTDLAPFPLGFFNAGLQGDIAGRIGLLAAARGVVVDDLRIHLVNHYWLTGSFIAGTGEGHAEAPDLDIAIESRAPAVAIGSLVAAALAASPAVALLRSALTRNTFALYVNGRRRMVEGVENSTATDAPDPYRVYAAPPRPLATGGAEPALIEKTGQREEGAPAPASPSPTSRVIRNIFGDGRRGHDSTFDVDTWLGLPGSSHFRIASGIAENAPAPSGLAHLCAGISFCYMTQLSRYIENMKMDIHGVRLVQFNPFVAGASASAGMIDTHLFLNGEAPDEMHVKLLTIAARTCYLHAAAATPLEPVLSITHNGARLDGAGDMFRHAG